MRTPTQNVSVESWPAVLEKGFNEVAGVYAGARSVDRYQTTIAAHISSEGGKYYVLWNGLRFCSRTRLEQWARLYGFFSNAVWVRG